MSPSLLAAHWGAPDSTTLALLALNAAVAALGLAARTVTIAGAVAGMFIGALLIVGTGVAGWTLLVVMFGVVSLTTRLGYARKARAGIAEERGGRRGPGNAIANTGVAAWAALVATGSADPALAYLAVVAALVTAGSEPTWVPSTVVTMSPGFSPARAAGLSTMTPLICAPAAGAASSTWMPS